MEVKEPQPAYQKQYYTIQEYLEMEKPSQQKHEYYQGEIFAMSGASPRHNVIFKNLYIELGSRLKGHPCQPYGSDLRIHIPENTLFTYPDISIICGDINTTDFDEDSAVRPTVLIEILSKSTRDYDRGGKFVLYRAIPTLKEYVLVDSQNVHVEYWAINKDNLWQLQEFKDKQQSFTIATIQLQIRLEDVYEGTRL